MTSERGTLIMYFAGNTSREQEQVLMDAPITHRLMSYGYLTRVEFQLRMWGVQRDAEQ